MNTEKIYARKCSIKEVGKSEKKKFLEENYLQGQDKSLIAYGLYNNDRLVSLMTFGVPKFTRGCSWELVRFCSLHGTHVIGGASRLLNYFINKHCKAGEKVVSYSDYGKPEGPI